MPSSTLKRNHLFAFGDRRLVGYLTFVCAFAPLSTDMYLPALPSMVAALGADEATVALTVSGFFLLFGLSMLFWGPLGDKYGRRPVMLLGCVLYIAASLAIARADSVAALLFWRGVQALGSGAANAMALAVVKDILRGKALEKVITWMQTITILAPMLAPVAGGALLRLTDWRGIFLVLAALGALALCGALGLRETCPPARRTRGPAFSALGRLFVVLRQREFAWTLLLFSVMCMPFMAYLGVSAYVFQNRFGLSPQEYSLFFAGNAAVSILGPALHMRIFHRLPRRRVIACHIGLACLSGLLLGLLGGRGPWSFALLSACITFAGSALRPPAVVLMMESVKGDNGSVIALINCGGTLFGTLSMFLATQPFWPGQVGAVGAITALSSGLCLAGWLALLRCGITDGRG